MHSKATIQRWVSVVQEHIGLCATRIPVLGFPQRNQQKDIVVQIGTNVTSQQMQTKFHRWQVAFTLDPVFFVASHCGIASPLLALLYRSLLR